MADTTVTRALSDPGRGQDHTRQGDLSTGSPAPRTGQLAPGDRLGRYTVISRLGGGGMGEVFAAHDPGLGRTIAVKVIHPDHLTRLASARLRLAREAQALARLRHPNIVTVYDVGGEGDQLFVAMELIEGLTIRAWLHSAPRRWRDVVGVFVAAGHGLAAAHEAGIIHRDFKPDNVIVGKDRVVVIDFGVARSACEPDAAAASTTLLDAALTATGDRFGTLPYMAPEQLAGRDVGAASDQFSFCVALWEALHGARPGSPTAPPLDAAVPGWVNHALERGLRAEPAERWPGLRELLDELSRDPRRTRNRVLIAGGALAVAVLAAWGLRGQDTFDPCSSGPVRVAEAWGPARAPALHAAYVAVAAPSAEDAFHRLTGQLDDYAGSWATMYGEACRATRVDGRQSDSMMDLRMACLERRRSVLGNLVDVWARGMDGDARDHALDAVRRLSPITDCADARGLAELAPPPSDPATRDRLASVRQQLDRSQAMIAAHRLDPARAAVAVARQRAALLDWAPLSAEAAFTEGDLLAALTDPSAEAPLLQASQLAFAAHDDRLAARALVRLVQVLAAVQQNAARGLLVAEVAAGLVERVGDPALRAELMHNRGTALAVQGKYDEAAEVLEAARAFAAKALAPGDRETIAILAALAELTRQKGDYAGARKLGEQTLSSTIAAFGEDSPQTVAVLGNLAMATSDADDRAAALAYRTRALDISERIAGPDAPPTATALNDVAVAASLLGQLDVAEPLARRALAIRERALGPDDPSVASSLVGLGTILNDRHRFEEAVLLDQRALDIDIKAYGPEHPRVAFVLHKLGLIYAVAERWSEALGYYQRALELRKKLLGPGHEMTLFTMALVGEAEAALHRCGEAMPLLTAAAGALERTVGRGHADWIRTVGPRARCAIADGRPAQAVELLNIALPLEEQPNHDAEVRAQNRLMLADALWKLGRRPDALAAARKAGSEVADDPRCRALVDGWLKAHR